MWKNVRRDIVVMPPQLPHLWRYNIRRQYSGKAAEIIKGICVITSCICQSWDGSTVIARWSWLTYRLPQTASVPRRAYRYLVCNQRFDILDRGITESLLLSAESQPIGHDSGNRRTNGHPVERSQGKRIRIKGFIKVRWIWLFRLIESTRRPNWIVTNLCCWLYQVTQEGVWRVLEDRATTPRRQTSNGIETVSMLHNPHPAQSYLVCLAQLDVAQTKYRQFKNGLLDD